MSAGHDAPTVSEAIMMRNDSEVIEVIPNDTVFMAGWLQLLEKDDRVGAERNISHLCCSFLGIRWFIIQVVSHNFLTSKITNICLRIIQMVLISNKLGLSFSVCMKS